MAKEIFGKKIPVTLKETIVPEKTALLIIDMQNDFCSQGGHYDQCGKNIGTIQAMIPNLTRLIEKFRAQKILSVYVQNTQSPVGAYLSPSAIAAMLNRWKDETKLSYTIEGTWGHQIVDEIKPNKNDLIVKKHRPSAFMGTDLDMILRGMGKNTIVVTGLITEGCVESTARDGWLRDYYVVVVEDCIGSSTPELHEAQLKIMRHVYHFVVSSESLSMLK